MALLNFDATQVEQQQAFEPLPAGWYPVMITASEIKATKANDGSEKLDLTFTVFDGPFKGRKIFNALNIGNKNPVAKEIAQKQLSTICHAINVLNVQQTEMLHEKPLMVRLKIRPADGNYGESNDVTGYKAYGAEAGAAPASIAPPVQQAPAFINAPQQVPAAPVAAQQPWANPVQQPAPAAPVAPITAPAAAPVVAPPGWEMINGEWVNVGVQAPAPAPAPVAGVPPWAQKPAG